MKIIHLTQGAITIVDDEDFDDLCRYTWYASGTQFRAARRLTYEEDSERRLIYIYHQILGVRPWELRARGLCVDHINRCVGINCRYNIRVVTATQNARNTDRHINRKGICFDKRHGKWKVYIDRPDMNRINVGTFLHEADALIALDLARKEYGVCA